MSRKLKFLLPLVLALIMLVALAAPAFAHVAPAGANTNNLQVAINRPGIVYHILDHIHYTVIVSVPANVGVLNALQTKINTYFDPVRGLNDGAPPADDFADDTFIMQIPSLLPGELYTFSETGHNFHEYDPQAGQPTRAELMQFSPDPLAMPASPTYKDTFTAAAHSILDYTIVAGDLEFVNGKYRVTAIARIINEDTGDHTGGAHDTDSGDNDSNDKTSDITSSVSVPETITTINATAAIVDLGQSVTLNVAEQNTGTVDLTSPRVVLLKNGAAFPPDLDKTHFYVSGDTDGDGELDGTGSPTGAETWIWQLSSGPLTVNPTTFQATGHGIDDAGADITFNLPPGQHMSERASVPITVRTPNTLVGISANINPLVLPPSGGLVDLTFTEANTGTVPLNSPSVTVLKDGLPFAVLVAPPTSGDAASLGVLDVSETWSWTISNILITATTTFQATGDATYGNPSVHVTWPDYPTERTNITIVVPPPQEVPASTDLGIGIMIAALAGVMALFIYRRTRRSQIS